jgi:two-component system, OmpR family, response regulator
MEVLVVEDEPKMRHLLEEALGEAGYAVRAVGDGAAAVALTGRAQFDAVVLDVNLPSMNGFEVLRVIRGRDDWTPVLMLTARDAITDRVTGLDGGADDYLIKPFAFTELLSRLRALLRRGAPASPTTISCGPLQLDPATRVVTVGGQLVDLSTREFELLEFFMRHQGQVLSRTVLIERVWGHNYDGFSNVVDVYIRYLRDKIDRRFGLTLIRTVRGVGYQLTCPGAGPRA